MNLDYVVLALAYLFLKLDFCSSPSAVYWWTVHTNDEASVIGFFASHFYLKESEDDEYDAAEYPQRVGRQKHVLDIDIQFNDTRRPGGGRGRGQRSGPRGNRGGSRGGGGDRRELGRDVDRPERRFRGEEPVSLHLFYLTLIQEQCNPWDIMFSKTCIYVQKNIFGILISMENVGHTIWLPYSDVTLRKHVYIA